MDNTVTLQIKTSDECYNLFILPKDLGGVVLKYSTLSFDCPKIEIYEKIICYLLGNILQSNLSSFSVSIIREQTCVFTEDIDIDDIQHLPSRLLPLFYICKDKI